MAGTTMEGNSLRRWTLGVFVGLATLAAPRVDVLQAQDRLASVHGALNNTWLGRSVAIDGTRVVVGAGSPFIEGGGPGGAYVYEVVGDSLVFDREVRPFGSSDVETWRSFGASVEVQGDRLFVGAPSADNADHGAVFIYERQPDGSWLGVQRLTESMRGGPGGYNSTPGGTFGGRIYAAGELLAVSAPFWDRWNPNPGRVFIFQRDGVSGQYVERTVVQN